LSTSIDLSVVAATRTTLATSADRAARRHPPRAQHQRDVGDPIHTYGTDITRIDSGACRNYD
jgi:hypothetical protein